MSERENGTSDLVAKHTKIDVHRSLKLPQRSQVVVGSAFSLHYVNINSPNNPAVLMQPAQAYWTDGLRHVVRPSNSPTVVWAIGHTTYCQHCHLFGARTRRQDYRESMSSSFVAYAR